MLHHQLIWLQRCQMLISCRNAKCSTDGVKQSEHEWDSLLLRFSSLRTDERAVCSHKHRPVWGSHEKYSECTIDSFFMGWGRERGGFRQLLRWGVCQRRRRNFRRSEMKLYWFSSRVKWRISINSWICYCICKIYLPAPIFIKLQAAQFNKRSVMIIFLFIHHVDVGAIESRQQRRRRRTSIRLWDKLRTRFNPRLKLSESIWMLFYGKGSDKYDFVQRFFYFLEYCSSSRVFLQLMILPSRYKATHVSGWWRHRPRCVRSPLNPFLSTCSSEPCFTCSV